MNDNTLKDRWKAQGLATKAKIPNPETAAVGFKADKKEKDLPKSRFFAVDTVSPHIVSFRLEKRDGHMVYIPYALQPVIEYLPDGEILISTMQKTVKITGRGLNRLFKWLGTYQVRWIKESDSGLDDHTEEMFVMDIEITDNL